MKSLKLCIIAFAVGVGIAFLTQNPVLETLGYLPEEKVEDVVDSDPVDSASNVSLASGSNDVVADKKPTPPRDRRTVTIRVPEAKKETKADVTSVSEPKPRSTSDVKAAKPDERAAKGLAKRSTASLSPKKLQPIVKPSVIADTNTTAKEAATETDVEAEAQEIAFKRDVFTQDGFDLPYRLLAPEVTGETKKTYPLLVFLHGADERGSDNEAQLKHGAKELQAWLEENKVDAYLLFPQCPKDGQWADHKWSETEHAMRSKPTKSMTALLGLLDKMLATEPIDTKRVYATGLSMGGYGVFDLVARRPDVFAAAAPLCGGADWQPGSLKKLLATPLFVVHGSKDEVVDVQNSREVVQALKENGANPIYIELQGVGHDCWSETFAEDTLFNWLFTKRKWAKPDTDIAEANPEVTRLLPLPKPKLPKTKIPKTKIAKRDTARTAEVAGKDKNTPKVVAPRTSIAKRSSTEGNSTEESSTSDSPVKSEATSRKPAEVASKTKKRDKVIAEKVPVAERPKVAERTRVANDPKATPPTKAGKKAPEVRTPRPDQQIEKGCRSQAAAQGSFSSAIGCENGRNSCQNADLHEKNSFSIAGRQVVCNSSDSCRSKNRLQQTEIHDHGN